MISVLERYRGSLFGLAAGDAVGTTVEFRPPGSFTPVTDMVGGGPFDLEPGQWTDDTSLALCLAESLVECQEFDPVDQLDRYVRWWRKGHLSSNGRCFDIGLTTREALKRFEQTGGPWCGPTDPGKAGNGSLMRLAPVPLFFARTPRKAVDRSGDSSRTTHGTRTAVDTCRYLGGLIVGAVHGATKDELLAEPYEPYPGCWEAAPLHSEVWDVACGSFKRKEPPEIRGSGYVVASLEAALWAFHRAGNFGDGCLDAVNLGDDADTTAAVYGQLAGAYFGVSAIPLAWREKIAHADVIEGLAKHLYTLSARSFGT